MNDPAILFVKPKAISAADKTALRAAGVIVVEVPDPSDVKLIRPYAEIPGSALLEIACEVIGSYSSNDTRAAFGKLICEEITERSSQTSMAVKPPR